MGPRPGFDSAKGTNTLSGNLLIVIEDPEERAHILRSILSEFPSLGFREVTGPVQYEHALAQDDFNLVITDYSLSWSNGIAIMAEVKERYPNTPVIMLVPAEQESIASEAMKAGLDDYVVRHKDRDPALRLQAVILGAVERANLRRQAVQDSVRLDQLFDTLPIAAYSTTTDGQLLEANPAFLTLLGIERIAADPPIFWRDLFVRAGDYEELRRELPATGKTQMRTVLLHRTGGPPVAVRLWETLAENTDRGTIVAGYLLGPSGGQQAEEPVPEKNVVRDRLRLLTPRENEVLDMVIAGMTNKLIASKLQISIKTVEMHRSHVMRKLRVSSLAELVRVALQAKLVLDDR